MIKIAKQLSIFLDNRPGALARVCEALANGKVNLVALSVIDTMDYAVVRMIVDKTQEAEEILLRLHERVQARDVVFMDISNDVGVLAKITQSLVVAGINLEYAYCTTSSSQGSGALILRTNDLEATINALS